jgi:hypothetical protein
MSPKRKNADVDPITLTVIWNRLLTLTRECGERVDWPGIWDLCC